jgi:hypothetical protein
MTQLSQKLFLDTKYSENPNESPAYTQWSIQSTQLSGTSAYAVSIDSFKCPHAVYPIRTGFNDKVYIDENGVDATLTITENNFTGSQISTELQTQLNAAGLSNTYAVAYDSQSKKLTITLSAGALLFSFEAGDQDAYEELGFTTGVIDTSYVGTYPVNLSGTRYLDLQMNFATNNLTGNHRANVMQRIPVNGSFGTVISWSNESDDWQSVSSLNSIYLRIIDDKGNLWTLPQNMNAMLTLKLQAIN